VYTHGSCGSRFRADLGKIVSRIRPRRNYAKPSELVAFVTPLAFQVMHGRCHRSIVSELILMRKVRHD
jgi:hypothetical protein